ncbi:hypothetical_protein [Candidozyma auris]|uniref:hypothetical_protein n=1 Tax=Candidozyma auris TaxID=498019 RepID=UPI000D270152|nr:hypothetical_protein [[Candida] auris]QEO22425.1 hypothetical_protein [[Candida] auris]GBL51166.1 hypothetical protein CAJCM15448_34400 [[Candida] auris]
MPGLESKWATAEPVPEKPEPKPKAPSTIASKWAHVEEEHQALHEKKPRKPRSGHPKERMASQPLTPPQSSGHEEMSELAKSFASRLGVKEDGGSNEKRHNTRTRRKSHGRKKKEETEAWENASEEVEEETEELFEDKLYEKEPMTEAARSLAMRIGVPAAEPNDAKEKASAQKPRRQSVGREDRHSHGRRNQHRPQAQPHASKENSQAQQSHKQGQGQFETQSKYMTPKQKKLLQEKMRLEELKAAELEKERKIKEEVKAMFEQMEDKSTNWADIDD